MRITVALLFLILSVAAAAQEPGHPYVFFSNSLMPGDYFYTRVQSTGDAEIRQSSGKLPVSSEQFHTPGNALVLHYRNGKKGSWNAAVYYHPGRGVDHFRTFDALSFWIYSKDELRGKSWPEVRLIRRDSSLTVPLAWKIQTTAAWQRVLVSLKDIPGYDKTRPNAFIGVQFSGAAGNGNEEHTMYIDDIEFTQANAPAINESPKLESVSTAYPVHIDLIWKKTSDSNIHWVKIFRASGNGEMKPVGIQSPLINRYTDFTGETGKQYTYAISYVDRNYQETKRSATVAGGTQAMNDSALLSMVQEACFRYYWEGAEPVSGLARENITGRQQMIATGASGFGIMALLVGAERHFITRAELATRMQQVLSFLEKADRFHGAYPHFIDGPTGKTEAFFGRRDNGADLVETSFLLQGLLAARQYFSRENDTDKNIRQRITAIWENVEWDWFRQRPDSKFLYWHWSPDQGWVINHNLIGWNETMVTYLLAIASPTHAVPASMYYSGWANREETGKKYRSGWGRSNDGADYINGKSYEGVTLDVGVNNGGPLFFTHYSFLGYDPHALTDRYTNYFSNNRNIALINYRYCVRNPENQTGYGENAWGLTASDGPYRYSADEPVKWQDRGKITPTGAIASMPYLPDEAMKALKNYYYHQGKFLWGEYGFRDAYDPGKNWCSEIFMGLNQAPMTVMIENYRSGLIWNLFMQDKDVQAGLKKLEAETKK